MGTALAIKQGTQTQTEGNMEQTVTKKNFSIENLDDVQAELTTWYSDELKPEISKYRN
jgi:hypothetical protein